MSTPPEARIDPRPPTPWAVPEAHERKLARLLECACRPDRPVLLRAPPGFGKTMLLHELKARLPVPLRAVYVPNPVLEPAELCAWTLGVLGSPRWLDPVPVLAAFAAHLGAEGAALVWLVDDAQGLPEETARWLGRFVARSAGALRLVAAALDDPHAKALEALGPLVTLDAGS